MWINRGVAGLYGMGNYISVTGYNSTITVSRTNFVGELGYQQVCGKGLNLCTALGLENIYYTSVKQDIRQTNLRLTKITLKKFNYKNRINLLPSVWITFVDQLIAHPSGSDLLFIELQ